MTGINKVFETTSCITGADGDDNIITVNSVSYDSDSFTATLDTNNGASLPTGDFRLLVCGSTSITNHWSDKLDGNEDLLGGEDYIVEFTVESDTICFPVKTPASRVSVVCL